MTLIDAGPLIELVGRQQPHHRACRQVFESTSLPLITTWACLTEASHLIMKRMGHRGREQLWQFINDGALIVHTLQDVQSASAYLSRIDELLTKYKDCPMDLADATLGASSELLETHRIFTLDKKHFSIYRTVDGAAFEIVPE